MDDLLNKLLKQLTDLANNFTDVFKNTIGSLIDTFEANRNYLESATDRASTYEFPLARIKDLKSNLNQTIKEMNIIEKSRDFLNMMLSEDGVKAWLNGNENEIFAIVNKYFTVLFSEYSRRTMTNYLQDKYKTTNTDQLVKSVRNDIMNQLDTAAIPMFWTSSQYSINNASRIGYITFPAVSEEVKQAAEQLAKSKETGDLNPRISHIQDRITIMRCLVGVPLYGYQGLLQFEDKSVGNDAIGRHLYEGKNFTNDDGVYGVGRDWRLLPSPIPYSLMTAQNNKLLKSNAEKAKLLYTEAEEKEIIKPIPGGTEYGIMKMTHTFMDEITRLYEAAKEKDNETKLSTQAKIKKLMEHIDYERDHLFIPNDGSHDLPDLNKRLVRIDHFVSAPKLQIAVEAEIAKRKAIEGMVQNLEPVIDNDLTEYQNALFAGVIALVGRRVEYLDEFEQQILLSSPDMLYGAAPLYQAFVSFKELSDTMRVKIVTETEAALKAYPLLDKTKESCQAIKKELKNKGGMVSVASKRFPRELDALKQFLTTIEEEYGIFTMTYGVE
jgi:hypothetical protein